MQKTLNTQTNPFTRSVNDIIIANLKKENLFNNFLINDINNGEVFPAFRNNRIDFYHEGSKLFSFDGKFRTNKKFASVIYTSSNNDYITENDLKNAETIKSFSNEYAYERIKEHAKLYSGEESKYVSSIYHKSSYASSKDDIVVLDIEAAFDGSDTVDTGQKSDRIDMVLLDKPKNTIYFIEAKHYSNREIWSASEKKPPVTTQLNRYNKQIKLQEDNIKKAYDNYIKLANALFGFNTIGEIKIHHETILLVFGFDKNQKIKLTKLLEEDNSLDGYTHRFIGNPTSASQILNTLTKSN